MSKKTKKTQSFSSIDIKDALKQKADLVLLGTTFRSNVNLQSIMWAASIYCKTLDSGQELIEKFISKRRGIFKKLITKKGKYGDTRGAALKWNADADIDVIKKKLISAIVHGKQITSFFVWKCLMLLFHEEPLPSITKNVTELFSQTQVRIGALLTHNTELRRQADKLIRDILKIEKYYRRIPGKDKSWFSTEKTVEMNPDQDDAVERRIKFQATPLPGATEITDKDWGNESGLNGDTEPSRGKKIYYGSISADDAEYLEKSRGFWNRFHQNQQR